MTVPFAAEHMAAEIARLRAEIETLNARLSEQAQAQQSAPAGYVMVPVEPSEKMLDILYRNGPGLDDHLLVAIWAELLAAAPKADPVQDAVDQVHELALKVRAALDRTSCPDAWMRIAYESVVANYASPQPPVQEPVASVPSLVAAYDMGAKGGPVVEGERLAFEVWMRGHCWAMCATWDGKSYVGDSEQGGSIDVHAMKTRMLWAAWRDRAALAAAPQPVAHDVEASVPTFPCESCGAFHSYSEVAEAGGYCPQCEADYDERKMLADLLERYAALTAAPAQPQNKE